MISRRDTKTFPIARLSTVYSLIRHFSHRQRLFLLPMLLILLVCGVVLVFTGGLSYVAPFVYAAF